MFLQLNPPLPITTPKGKAWAVALIDYGPQWDLQWVTFVKETGECWTFRNPDIRQDQNDTFGLPKPTPIQQPALNGNGAAINGHDINGNGTAMNEHAIHGNGIAHDYSDGVHTLNGH